jgi:hypothetical protein
MGEETDPYVYLEVELQTENINAKVPGSWPKNSKES